MRIVEWQEGGAKKRAEAFGIDKISGSNHPRNPRPISQPLKYICFVGERNPSPTWSNISNNVKVYSVHIIYSILYFKQIGAAGRKNGEHPLRIFEPSDVKEVGGWK